MTVTWSDPRGSTPTTSQARPGVVVAPSIHAAIGKDASIAWGKLGLALHDRGWAVLPQTRGDDGQRMPGGSLEWGARGGQVWKVIPYKSELGMHLRMPPRELVERWTKEHHLKRNNMMLNVAGVPGEASGDYGWFAIDADVYDPKLMQQILAGADRILGRTPFFRGRVKTCKGALIYRRALGALRLPIKTITFVERWKDDKDAEHKQQIEIKDNGSLITLYGVGPGGDPYRWLRDAEPYTSDPSISPEVDEEQILAFFAFVNSLSPIEGFDRLMREARKEPVLYADVDVGEIRVPRMSNAMATAEKISDGRNQWLFSRSASWVRLNAGIVAPIATGVERKLSDDGVKAIAAALIAESELYIDYDATGGKNLTRHNRARLVEQMVRNTAMKLARGEEGFEPVGRRRLDPVTLVAEPEIGQGVEQTDDEYSWMPNAKDRERIGSDDRPMYRRTSPNKEIAAEIALDPDRTAIKARVAHEIRTAIMTWLDELWMHRQSVLAGEALNRVPAHLLKAPTGSGKTTALIQCIGEWKRAHPGCDLGPILMLLPSYNNIAEIASREDLGVWTDEHDERASEIIAEAEGTDVHVMRFMGKLAAGCFEEERVRPLQAAGINTSGLCSAKEFVEVEHNGIRGFEEVTRWCKHHPDNPDRPEDVPACNAILQRLKIPKHDIILAPHAFLTTTIPKELKEGVVAVVVDEKVWDKTIGVRVFPVSTFLSERPEADLTKHEKSENEKSRLEPDPKKRKRIVDAMDRQMSRNRIGEKIHEAALARTDIAKAILDAKLTEDLADAQWFTGRLQRVVMEINPSTTLTAIMNYTRNAQTKHLVEEHKTLGLIQERVDDYRASTLIPKGHDLYKVQGDTDARIQLVNDGADIRIAWRRKINFDHLPFLFLDASGNKKIMEKVWGRDIVVHDIKAPLYVRTVLIADGSYAKSRILPGKDDNAEVRLGKASRQVLLREALTTISIAHGDGAVVAASALEVRKHIQRDWPLPINAHWMHYGALRGLDFAKRHSAAFSIGQLELRPLDLDAYVAAFTYDERKPERPTDPYGNGRVGPKDDADPIQRRLVDRVYQLRDGGTATVQVYEPEGEWARMIVEQVREEELSQFLGRLRPVYRTGRAPTWYHCGRVLPAGVIVDEVIGLKDLARPFGRTLPVLHEVAVGGVLTSVTTGGFHLSGLSNSAIANAHAAVCGSERWQRGMHEIEYKLAGSGDVHRAFVPGFAIDPLEALRMAVDGLASAAVVREARVSRYEAPAPDKVELELGPMAARVAAYDMAMADIGTRVDMELLKYDEKRHGISHAGRSQAPHLFAAIEAMKARVVALSDAAKIADLDNLPAEHFMLGGMDEKAIAKVLEIYEAGMLPAILARAGVDVEIREKVIAMRPPLDVSFGEPLETPSSANGDVPLPALPANVFRFGEFRPRPVTSPTKQDAATG